MTVATSSRGQAASAANGETLLDHYRAVRRCTVDLCRPLAIEDYGLQSMPAASPAKWHLAHTTWFFEAFVLTAFQPAYRPFHPEFSRLFNSYYQSLGPRWPQGQRGLLSRPTVEEVYRYRAHVDEHLIRLFPLSAEAAERVLLGLHHEQQHQELILTDVKHAWSANPLRPVYADPPRPIGAPPALTWLSFDEGLVWIGHEGAGFAYDNEGPRHRVWLDGFELASRLVSNQEYLAFMNDGGYQRPELWLSDGWTTRQAHGWNSPLYWERQGEDWSVITLAGTRPVQPAEPVCHVSFYEADAFARWCNARLPIEAEWETAAAGQALSGHFLESKGFQPVASPARDDLGPLHQLFGDVWQWTASPYVGYPGYRPAAGAIGEYNGKFMCNQFVLRGASCLTPRSHARATYRNFFPPETRWQTSGIRLARDLPSPAG